MNLARTTSGDDPLALSVPADRDPYISACPAWCTFTHRFAQAADRSHYGTSAVVALSLDVAEPDDELGSYELGSAQAYLRHHYREVDPVVHLGFGEDQGKYFTLDEAQELAEGLLQLVAQAKATAAALRDAAVTTAAVTL